MHYLQTHWAGYSALAVGEQERFLQKAFEAPMHVARKTLAWFGPLQGDSKAYVEKMYTHQMPGDMAELLKVLRRVDADYSAELERQILYPRRREYLDFLHHLERMVPETINFVGKTLLYIDQQPR
jgi:hypothetical protein